MNKIIDVINNMIKNPDKISDIERSSNSFYFSYKGYMWSIWEWSNFDDTGVSLAYYPFAKNFSEAAVQKDYMVYSSDESEFGEAFNRLYHLIKEKFYGIEKAFDEILKD